MSKTRMKHKGKAPWPLCRVAAAWAGSAFDALSPQHKKFVRAFMKHFNATRAYTDAGYRTAGARQAASRLMLTNVDVQAAIREALEREGVTETRLKIALAGIAFGDEPSKIVAGPNARREQDRLAALRELARVQGMVTRKHEVKQVQDVRVVFDDTDPAERVRKAKAMAEQKRAADGGGR